MLRQKKGVILIGMPGAGKSTLGVLLAKELGFNFVDTDLSIQVHAGQTLQDILDQTDYLNLRRIEEEVLMQTDCYNMVVATGGSAAYSDLGMSHLKEHGVVIFLDTPLIELKKRINNYETRGIARRPDQSFQDLFDERQTLYRKYADINIDCHALNQQQALNAILKRLGK